jgi:diguanylate cyclase (GGDEF)-like protein
LLSRQGGDEFVVVLQELKCPEDAEAAVGRLLRAVADVHSIDRHEIYVTTSIGVSVYPGDGLDAETLIKNADTAMYHAKKSGKQDHKFFSLEMTVESAEQSSIEQDLWHAMDWYELRSGPAAVRT